jgi:hypothetical protein
LPSYSEDNEFAIDLNYTGKCAIAKISAFIIQPA